MTTDHAAVARHWCDLDALKAEVEALLTEAEALAFSADHDGREQANGRYDAYTQVLDLIDKHREGQ